MSWVQCIVMSQQRNYPSCPYALYIHSVSCPGLFLRSTSSPWTLPASVFATMIYESGSGFWEKTLALHEDRCFPSVRRTKELILHIATSSQLLKKICSWSLRWYDLNQRIQNLFVLLFCIVLIVSSLPGIPHIDLITWWWSNLSVCWTCLCRMLADSSQTAVCIYSFYPLAEDASTYTIQNLKLQTIHYNV